MPSTPITPTSIPRTKLSTNSMTIGDHPDHRYQVNHDLLYECEFERGAFVSAHLQRLQNGCFTDNNIHTKDTLHVTFAAITFTFHPVTSSGGSDHRFESAVIEIVAKSNGLPLKFLKHAPHLAFGRISSSNLRWNFSLGATVGISSATAKAAVNPGIEYERDTVVGTMMKIQGSTRSTQLDIRDARTHTTSPARIPDTKLVWTLEENIQQKAGIPREFTFVFLMERPVPSTANTKHEKAKFLTPPKKKTRSHSNISSDVSSNVSSSVCSTPINDRSPATSTSGDIIVQQSVGIEMTSDKEHYNFLLDVPDPLDHTSTPQSPANGMIDNLRAEAERISKKFHLRDESLRRNPTIKKTRGAQSHAHMDEQYHSVFQDITFSIAVKPDIAGLNVPKSLFEHHAQHVTVRGEVGQKFSAMSEAEEVYEERGGVEIDGLYNFTRLPVNFEELIEFPGSTTSSVEPSLPAGGHEKEKKG